MCIYANMISVTKRIQGKSSWFNSAALKLFCWVNIRTSWTPVADIWSAVPVVSLNKTKPHYLIWGPGCLLSTEQNSSVWSDVPTDHSSLIKTQRTQEKVKQSKTWVRWKTGTLDILKKKDIIPSENVKEKLILKSDFPWRHNNPSFHFPT